MSTEKNTPLLLVEISNDITGKLSQINQDMSDKFHNALDSFLINFTETWKDSSNLYDIVMMVSMILQKYSLDTIDSIVDDCTKQDFDILDATTQLFTKQIDEIKQKHNLK